jgi:ABC-type multidrug transport system fused ATPase/permease subunit
MSGKKDLKHGADEQLDLKPHEKDDGLPPIDEKRVHEAFESAKRHTRRAGSALDLVCQPELTPDTTAPLRTTRGQWRLVLFAIRTLLPFWHLAFFILLCAVVMGIVKSLAIWPLSLIIDYALPDQNWKVWWAAVAMGLGIWIVLSPGIVFRWPTLISEFLNVYLLQSVRVRLRIHFVKHLQKLSLRFFQRRPTGEHMYRAIDDIDWIVGLIVHNIPRIIQYVAEFLWLILVVGLVVSRTVAMIVVLYMVPLTVIYHILLSWIRKVDRRSRAREQAVNAVLQEGIAGVQTVKAFGRERHELRKFIGRHCDMFRVHTLRTWLGELQVLLFGFIFSPGILPWLKSTILTFWSYYLVVIGELTLGKAIVMVFWVDALTGPLSGLISEIQQIRLGLIPAERVFETMSIEPMVQDDPKAAEAPPLQGNVEFNDVRFSYIPGVEVLKGMSFMIRSGETVGIVGPSGAGKSTLAKLALRLYDADSGSIRMDGWDIKSVKMETMQTQIGTVMQDTYLFQGTIREQLLFGNPHAGEEEILEAVEAADLADFIRELPDGLDTNLAEGTRLSGGQRQRIGIARALVRDPQFMILDEPTASLDSSTEAEVMQTLFKAMQGRSALIISHRLALVSPLDRIIVIDEGRVVEQGTHKDLISRGGLYAELWKEQYGEAESA